MANTQIIEMQGFNTGNIETLDIAGYTTSEIAREWLSSYGDFLSESLSFHKDDEEFVEDLKDGVPAELLNTAEQDAWNLLRTEYGAFGLDTEAEEYINDFVTTWREDGTLNQVTETAVASL